MILLLRLQGQDGVDIAVENTMNTGDVFVVYGQCRFDHDASHLLLSCIEHALQNAGMQVHEITGIAVEWSTTARFTVSRLTGVLAGTLAHSLRVPVAGFAEGVHPQTIIDTLQHVDVDTQPSIDIVYSGEPTITIKNEA